LTSPAHDAAARFLRVYFADADSWEDAAANLAATARANPRPVQAGLSALEALLAAPQPAGTLRDLVGYHANWRLDSGEEAEWLRRAAGLARQALANAQGT
jgi:hypothetical protein